MIRERMLHRLLDESAGRHAARVAVDDPDRTTICYADLARLSDCLRDRLHHIGVRPGDRVGLYMRKSIDAVAAIFGILKAGAAYVPVDPTAPAARCAYIFSDCDVRAVLAERALAASLLAALAEHGELPRFLLVDEPAGPLPLERLIEEEERTDPAPEIETIVPALDDLAYILYTSGSTGRPKGVMLTHGNALSFVDWCSTALDPQPHDVFSSHAPFHFDLSILDLFVSMKHGAKLVLIGEELGKDPLRLAPVIARQRITVWYSTPSILSLLAHYGKLDRYDYGALRLVLFAGEVFPIPHLRALKALWPAPRYLNLYGPTETNVCAWHEIPTVIPQDRTEPFPIGRMCTPFRGRVVDAEGVALRRGEEGELVVRGPGVMAGYWNLPEQNSRAFLTDARGERWYRTGDLVTEREDGEYDFRGRRDRMVKRRGYRVELGEIEAGLASHPDAREVAVVAKPDPASGVQIQAYVSLHASRTGSVIALKEFCARKLPRYMVPDTFAFVHALPRTSTDKIDYASLTALR